MKRFKTTENVIILMLWVTSVWTYSFALLKSYSLFLSDYLGLAGLFIVTLICIFHPKLVLRSLSVLLILGLFNIVSFIYFFNVVMTFGFSTLIMPGIQLLSLIALLTLFYKRSLQMTELWAQIFGQSDENKLQGSEKIKNSFKEKFSILSDKEIESHLQEDLVHEARQALTEILDERKHSRLSGISPQ